MCYMHSNYPFFSFVILFGNALIYSIGIKYYVHSVCVYLEYCRIYSFFQIQNISNILSKYIYEKANLLCIEKIYIV